MRFIHMMTLPAHFSRLPSTGATSDTLPRDVERAKTMARWLDTRFSFLGYRFGFETILGMLPIAGDTATAILGLYPILIAMRHRLGKGLQFRMLANLLIEWLIGMVPFLGDLFDTVFKANIRNARLLEAAAYGSNVGVERQAS
jgi:hypothetical protein